MIGVRPDNQPGRRWGSDPAGLVVRFHVLTFSASQMKKPIRRYEASRGITLSRSSGRNTTYVRA
jgi:hypothetical protein